MVAGAEIDAVLRAGKGSVLFIDEDALEVDIVDRTECTGRPLRAFRCDLAGIDDGAVEQGLVEPAIGPHAFQTNAVTGGSVRGRRLPAAGNRAVVGDGDVAIAGFGERQRHAGAIVAFTGVDRSLFTVVQGVIGGRVVGIDGAVALIAGAQDLTVVLDREARPVDVEGAAVGRHQTFIGENAAGMVAGAEIDAILSAGENTVRPIDQGPLEVDVVDGTERACRPLRAFGGDFAGIDDAAVEQGFIETAIGPHAFQTNAVAGSSRCGRGLSATRYGAGIDDFDVAITVFGQRQRDAGAVVAFAGVDRAAAGIGDGKVSRRVIGVDRAVALVAGSENLAGIDQIDVRSVNVDGAAAALDRARIDDVQVMLGIADIQTVAHAFDHAGRGVYDRSVEGNPIGDTQTGRGALVAFRRDEPAVDDVAVKGRAGLAIVDADAVTGKRCVGRGLAAALDRAAEIVGDRAGRGFAFLVSDFQRNARALIAFTGIDGGVAEVADREVVG